MKDEKNKEIENSTAGGNKTELEGEKWKTNEFGANTQWKVRGKVSFW